MRWTTNRDEALVLEVDGITAGGVWRGAWFGERNIVSHGYLAAIWHPYKRIGRFLTVKEAKSVVEELLFVAD